MLLDMILLGKSPTYNSYDMLSSIFNNLNNFKELPKCDFFLVFNTRLCYGIHMQLILHLFDHFLFKYTY